MQPFVLALVPADFLLVPLELLVVLLLVPLELLVVRIREPFPGEQLFPSTISHLGDQRGPRGDRATTV